MRTGYAQLPLHGGKAPSWLFSRMTRLAREIVCHIVSEYGSGEVLVRLSDPYWFQAFGSVLGFDWHSSGVTTTTCGAVKEGIKGLERDLGLYAAGGKGGASRKTPDQITRACERLSQNPADLVHASRISAKVDNSAVQDGFQLYHHSFFFTDKREWCLVQQGFNDSCRSARRYHWLSKGLGSFVEEPHTAICSDSRAETLDLTARESRGTRDAVTEIAGQPDRGVLRDMERFPNLVMPDRHWVKAVDINPKYLRKIMLKTYEERPGSFEELLSIRGVGPKTLRALTLVSELIYGTRASVKDPARFSFAHGGKDGTPFPVDRETYEKTISVLHDALRRARVERSEKLKAIKRLSGLGK